MASDKIIPFSNEDKYGAALHFEEEAGKEAEVTNPAPPFEPLAPFFVPYAKEEFPVEMLPALAGEMVSAVAESTQTTIDMAGTCVLADPGLIGVHPNDNTATVWMKTQDLIHLLRDYGTEVHVVPVREVD